MGIMDVPTKFAPAALALPQKLQDDHALVTAQTSLMQFLQAVSGMIAVLNPERQFVYASADFVKFLGAASATTLVGKRPGQALQCVHQSDEPGGCGTSEACSVCRLTDSILESGRVHDRVSRECRLTTRAPGTGTLDLSVTSTPWNLEGRTFTVLSVRDIGVEKRQKTLERVFFHDIVNTAGGLSGILGLLADYPDLNAGKALVGMSQRSAEDILEEILAFQQLKLAEAGELVVKPTELRATRVVQEVVDKVRYHTVAEGRRIEIESDEGDALVASDRLLLERVLVNMVKNAFEASTGGSAVTVGWRRAPKRVVFWVHNSGVMPRDVQLQIFQRSFSTKGLDRGLGTYSMRLIGEACLGGRVAFTSSEAGTEFTLSLPQSNRNEPY
jgi:K+-sensing histidine kinase KdpD